MSDAPETPAMARMRRVKPAFYAHLYALLGEQLRPMGYALLLHGSLLRDCDLVAVPWSEQAVSAEEVIAQIIETSGGFLAPHEVAELPRPKPHGRLAWSIHFGGGAYLDVSVMPRKS